jgi:hypothetical protein
MGTAFIGTLGLWGLILYAGMQALDGPANYFLGFSLFKKKKKKFKCLTRLANIVRHQI